MRDLNMNKSVELGLYFVPQTMLKDSMPYIHRIWQGYNVFYYNAQERCWSYQLKRNFSVKIANDKDGYIVIYMPKIKRTRNKDNNKISLKVYINNLFNAFGDDESKKAIKQINTQTRATAIEFMLTNQKLTKLQALSLCVSAFPANLVVESAVKQITETSIIKSLSPMEVDEFIGDMCNDYGYLLGWTNQKLLGEQYAKTNLDAVGDANFVVEMLSKIDVTALYKVLGFYKEDEDEKR